LIRGRVHHGFRKSTTAPADALEICDPHPFLSEPSSPITPAPPDFQLKRHRSFHEGDCEIQDDFCKLVENINMTHKAACSKDKTTTTKKKRTKPNHERRKRKPPASLASASKVDHHFICESINILNSSTF